MKSEDDRKLEILLEARRESATWLECQEITYEKAFAEALKDSQKKKCEVG